MTSLPRPACNAGFTMVELVSVMVIIGIIGAMAASRYGSDESGTVSGRDRARAHIRYAQILALKSHTVCGIRFNGTQYWIFRNGNPADRVSMGDDGPVFILPDGLTANQALYFDLWGVPFTDSALTTPWAGGAIENLGLAMAADTGFVR